MAILLMIREYSPIKERYMKMTAMMTRTMKEVGKDQDGNHPSLL